MRCGLLVVAAVSSACAAQHAVGLVGSVPLPGTAADQHGEPFEVGGLSGVTYLGEDGGWSRFGAVMDNSDKLLFVRVRFGADGEVTGLDAGAGLTIARRGDHEGVAWPGGGSVLVSNETSSQIREFDLVDGSLRRTLGVPDVFGTRRPNLGLESLSFDPASAWTANEEALPGDGERATPDHGTVVRLLRERVETDAAIGQYAYLVEPMHGPAFPFGDPGRSGLCDLVALPDGTVLALERSLAFTSPFFLTRVFGVSFAGADDVTGMGGLLGAEYRPVGKELLYEGGHDNLEGLCLGPRLAGGGHVLVGVVDDGDPLSGDTLVVFRLEGVRACPEDVNDDGVIDVGDLHDLHQEPRDLDGDGEANAEDARCLERYLRRHEGLDRPSRGG